MPEERNAPSLATIGFGEVGTSCTRFDRSLMVKPENGQGGCTVWGGREANCCLGGEYSEIRNRGGGELCLAMSEKVGRVESDARCSTFGIYV